MRKGDLKMILCSITSQHLFLKHDGQKASPPRESTTYHLKTATSAFKNETLHKNSAILLCVTMRALLGYSQRSQSLKKKYHCFADPDAWYFF
jgi:hypothetical protein